MSTHPTMQSRIEGYLAMRRQLGFSLHVEGKFLTYFARFADRSGHHGPLTTDLAIRWATALRKPNALTSAYRMGLVRNFARHWQVIEPATQIPPAGLFGRSHRRITPHIYTEEELCELIAAADRIPPLGCLRAKTCATAFGLVAAAGLRISEAIALRRADVILAKGLLHIRHAKFGKFRWVPIHRTTVQALRRYARRRDEDRASASTDAFFVFDHGRPATYRKLAYAFRELRRRLQWRARGGYPVPRLHDARHTFVCRRLERWSQAGEDLDCNI
ncbi:MAG: tyrosine-type recombinase/integrase, partial [Vulcanimicrobiaceae bacterium]